ncbi:MAG: hypothetical protein R2764_18010 [Bacteroidales bacterium]
MKRPFIYLDEIYIFDFLIITNVRFVSEKHDSYIELTCMTPKYDKIFGDAWFQMKPDTLFAIVDTIELTKDKDFKNKFKNILDEKMALPSSVPVEISIIELKKHLGTLPVVNNCSILAIVKEFEFEDDRINWIEFKVGNPKENVMNCGGQVPDNYKRKIIDIAADIKTLAMQEGYDLTSGWDYLNAMFELESVDDYYGADRGSYIIKVFLGYLKYWRTDKIKQLRQELKDMLK